MVGQGDPVALLNIEGGQLLVRVGDDPAAAISIFQQDVTADGLTLFEFLTAVELFVDPQNTVLHYTFPLFIRIL